MARRAEFREFKRKGQRGHILEQLDSGGGVAACGEAMCVWRADAQRGGTGLRTAQEAKKGGGVRMGGAGIAAERRTLAVMGRELSDVNDRLLQQPTVN